MIKVTATDTMFELAGSPLDRDEIRRVNGVTAVGDVKFLAPLSYYIAVDLHSTAKTYGWEMDRACLDAMKRLDAQMKARLAYKETKPEGKKLGEYSLYPEQAADISFLRSQGSGLILSEMRTGKTLTALGSVDKANLPALVAVIPSTVLEMKRQVVGAFPDLKVAALTTGMTALQREKVLNDRFDILICGHNLISTYSRIHSWGGLSKKQRDRERASGLYEDKIFQQIGFRTVIFDEAHVADSEKSQTMRGIWWLGDHAQSRYALTGTPAPNAENELWPLLRFVDPVAFRNKTTWEKKYIIMEENFFGFRECKGLNPLFAKQWDKIFEAVHVRRVRATDTEVEYRTIPVELSSKQRTAYKNFKKEGMAWAEGGVLTATDSMSLRHRLAELTIGTQEVNEEGKVVKLHGPSPKLQALVELLKSTALEKAIVVAERRKILSLVFETLDKEKIKYVKYVGGMKPAEQQKAISDFQTGDAQVICINAAGAAGIELSKAKRTIFVQQTSDLAFRLQAESRNMSRAQENEMVEIVDIICADTLEEKIHLAFRKKEKNLHELLRDVDWLRENM